MEKTFDPNKARQLLEWLEDRGSRASVLNGIAAGELLEIVAFTLSSSTESEARSWIKRAKTEQLRSDCAPRRNRAKWCLP